MKHLCLLLLCVLSTAVCLAQFSIESPDYSGEVPVDVSFTDHTVYISNELPDSLYLGWKMVENTCPVEWTYVLCDYGFCYDGLPPSGTMQAVPEGEDAFLKLSVFANGTDGSGYIRFWVYESDNQSDYQVITFWFNMPVGIAETTSPGVMLRPNPASDQARITIHETSTLTMRTPGGRVVHHSTQLSPGEHTIDVSALNTGIYILQISSASGTQTLRLQRSQ